SGKPKEYFSFSKNEVVSYLKKAAPVVLNEGMWGGGTFVYNVIFANMGYEYFSAVTILRSFENIALVMFFGMGSAASVMIGKSIGKGKIKEAVTDSKRFCIIVPVLAVILSVFIVIFRHQLVGIFNMGSNISELTLKTANIIMVIYAVAFPTRMLPYIQIVGIFRSGGDTVTGTKFELFCLWALSVPATIIAVYVFKVPFVVAFAIMYIFEDIPKNIFSIRHFLSNKWIKPVTKEGMAGLERLKEEMGDE
ncbi:MAG: MATE family efflux transporter, partial [Eubacterium sp.]